MTTQVTITVNGAPREVPAGTSLAALIEALGLAPERVAVELDRSIVRRSEHGATVLRGGEVLEVVTLVGGG